MSADNCIAEGERQKSLPAKRIEFLTSVADLSTVLPEDQLKNFKRNEQLIDLHMIPENLRVDIMAAYQAQAGKTKHLLLAYLKKHKLNSLTELIGDF
jgi:hypothetical protein